MLQYAVYRQNVMSNLNLEEMCPSCQEVGDILCSIVNCFNLILLIIEMIFLFFGHKLLFSAEYFTSHR